LFFKAFSFVAVLFFLAACGTPNSSRREDYVKAKLAYSQGRIDEAVRSLAVLVSKDGSFAPARLLYGRALYFHRDYEKAREVLSALGSDRPESVEAWLWLVRTLVEQKKTSDAEILLIRLMACNPDDPRLAYQMALVRENRGDLQGAQDFLASAEGADEDLALVHYESARVACQLHKADRARAELVQALGFLSASSLLRKPIERLLADLSSNSSNSRTDP
jgi:tetratricopeptide (TPR) repeat protein